MCPWLKSQVMCPRVAGRKPAGRDGQEREGRSGENGAKLGQHEEFWLGPEVPRAAITGPLCLTGWSSSF